MAFVASELGEDFISIILMGAMRSFSHTKICVFVTPTMVCFSIIMQRISKGSALLLCLLLSVATPANKHKIFTISQNSIVVLSKCVKGTDLSQNEEVLSLDRKV